MKKLDSTLKRIFDIAAASVITAALAVPVTGLAITMSAFTRNTPFFIQSRIGKDGKSFRILKIKTMRDAFNAEGQLLPQDLRTPAFGVWLRKSKIDELPQMINIIKGEMSLVGPRPTTAIQQISHDTVRQSVRPGLTGLAQIEGMNMLSDEEKLKYDQAYVEEASFINDVKILIKTPLSILKNMKQPHFDKNLNFTHHI